MLIVKATGFTEAGVKTSLEYDEALSTYKQSLSRAGMLLAEEKLQPSFSGFSISYPSHGEAPEIRSGPFSLERDIIAGFSLIDARSEEEALEWALRMPVPEGRGKFELEIRRFEEHPELLHGPGLGFTGIEA
ncbi:YciI family protein [Cohnella terricola]|uniref:YciI family protein n=1 Tax=Cohnella terricola TaxID=1289167 RepID=UPI001FE77180|nr:YciI family protein [Cohnella terricola]